MEKLYKLVSKISGIHCGGCINRINSKLLTIGAQNVDLELSLDLIKIDYFGKEADADKFIQAIIDLGYSAKKIVVFDPEEVFNGT